MTLAEHAAAQAALRGLLSSLADFNGLAHLRELVEVGELQIAAENLSDNLFELARPLTGPQLDAFRSICDALHLPEDLWRTLERLRVQ